MNKNRAKVSEAQQERFSELQTSIDREMQQLSELHEKAKREKTEDIRFMIQYYRDMTDKIEDRRTRIQDFTLQMLAICITGALLIYTLYAQIQGIKPVFFWTVEIVLFAQIIFCLVSAFVYEKQSAFRYVFLDADLEKYGAPWKWFYYGNKPLLGLSTGSIWRSKKFQRTKQPYLEALHEFVKNYREETLDKEISESIGQLYVLQAHNYYKNKFYLELTKIRQWSITSIPIIIAAGLLCYLIWN